MSTEARRAIYGKLAGDTTLNTPLGTPAPGSTKSIYYQIAAKGAETPFVVFQKQAGTPTYTFTTVPAYESDVWMIKGVGSADQAEAIQARLKTLLNDAVLSISGATKLYLRRESDIDFSEETDGVVYRHAGSLYRLVFQ